MARFRRGEAMPGFSSNGRATHFAGACSRNSGLPAPGTPQYRDLVHAFNVGLAGLQSGEDVRAKTDLTLATQIAPGEPASWADLAILAVRQQELDAAYDDLEKARQLAPDNSRIEQLLGDLESRRGKLPEAIGHLKRAVDLDKDKHQGAVPACRTNRVGKAPVPAIERLSARSKKCWI